MILLELLQESPAGSGWANTERSAEFCLDTGQQQAGKYVCWTGVRAVFRVLNVPHEQGNQRKESFIFLLFIYLAVGLGCGTRDFQSSL